MNNQLVIDLLEHSRKRLFTLIDAAPKGDRGGFEKDSAREQVTITINTIRRLWELPSV